MFLDENVIHTKEQKHEYIVTELNRALNGELRSARLGFPDHETIVHLQRQIRFHRDCLLSE